MKKWNTFTQEIVDARSKHIMKWLKLPNIERILENMDNKTKLRFVKNSPLAYVNGESRDKVFGFIIGNPGIMTPKYNKFISTEIFQECP